MLYFQDIIKKLQDYWNEKGCAVHQGYDLETGAGTFNPATFFRSLGPEPYKAAYVEPSRRPTDGRYGDNPNRLQHYFQFQVIFKPPPENIQKLYLDSLKVLGLDMQTHDIRFIHDDWKAPTLGARGLGWEVSLDGIEISQFTYFQTMGGIDLPVITGEISYGLERLAVYLQEVDSVYDLKWNKDLTYGDIYLQGEKQWSRYNFEEASIPMWKEIFESSEREAKRVAEKSLVLPAYDFVMKASHAFNMLEAGGALSVTERAAYIQRIRSLACLCAYRYVTLRESLHYPLLKEYKISRTEKKVSKKDFFDMDDPPEDFVLEIGSEELPPAAIPSGIRSLRESLESFFKGRNIAYKTLEVYGSPRRITAYVEALSKGAPEEIIERKGPPLEKAFNAKGAPTNIGIGFLQSIDKKPLSLNALLNKKDPDLFIQQIKNVDYLFASLQKPSTSTREILASSLPKLIQNLDFPEKMIWSDPSVAYPRPLRWILALHGSSVISFRIGDISSSNYTFGHRLLDPRKIMIKKPEDYFTSLREAYVIVDHNERLKNMEKQIALIEKKQGAKLTFKNKVLREVLQLCEYPSLFVGEFDAKYLELPEELLSLVMVHHQRYFPMMKNERLVQHFAVCVDHKPHSKMKRGHERAMIPRFEDASFMYHRDRSEGMDHFAEKLAKVTFQEGLGSLQEKADRLERIAFIINQYFAYPLTDSAIRDGARFAKADLTSSLVYEFPELQGIIGKHYAEKENFPEEVCQALEEHWLPRFEEDKLPKTPLGILLAVSDKIDNLLASFLNGKIPTSSSDPFALRRQTFGILKILIENKLFLPLDLVFAEASEVYEKKIAPEYLSSLLDFVRSRMKTVLASYFSEPDEIASLLKGFSIFELYLKGSALREFRKNPRFPLLIEAFKRSKGQLHTTVLTPITPSLFQEEPEILLHKHLLASEPTFQKDLKEHRYSDAFLFLASLQPYLSELFEKVQILVPDEKIRMNRLALLSHVVNLFDKLIDFSLIRG